MNKKNMWSVILVFCLTVSLSIIGLAQEGRGRGRIRGSVQDTAGNPLSGVKITVTHVDSGTTFNSVSNDRGNWAVNGLGTGYFRITADLEGYNPIQHDMNVSQFSRNNPPIEFTLQKIQTQTLGVPGLQDEKALATFEEASALFEAEQFAEAAAKFEEFLSQNPDYYQININIGNCYRELGDYDRAIAAYNLVLDNVEAEGATEGSDKAIRAFSAIGETLMKKGDLEEASQYLQKAMELNPSDETLAFNIGEIFFKQGDSARGIEYFDQAITIRSDWAPPYRQRGYAYLNLADYKNAVESFIKFVELAPDDPLTPTIENLIPQLEKMIK